MGDSRLRIAINAVPLAPGGGLVCLLGYLTAWQEMDADLEITVYASRQAVIDAVGSARPDLDVIPFALGQPPRKHFFLQQTRLGSVVMEHRPDLVVSTQYGIRKCLAPQLIRHENLLRFICPTFWDRLRKGTLFDIREAVRDMAARSALHYSVANVFISDYMRRQTEASFPDSAPRNHVIYNGVSDKVIKASRVVEPSWDGQPNLVAIQDTRPHKDNPTLVRTLAELVRRRPSVPWHLHVAGGGDWATIKLLARQLGVLGRITFHGYLDQDQLDTLLRKSLCLVFTSIVEGFGIPPIEAMARRCPAIACDCTAMPEIIGDAGILVLPGDSGAFAESVVDLYEDPRKRQQLVEKGINRVTKFCWQESAAAMLALFRKSVSYINSG